MFLILTLLKGLSPAIATANQTCPCFIRQKKKLNSTHKAAAKPAWFLWKKIPRHAPIRLTLCSVGGCTALGKVKHAKTLTTVKIAIQSAKRRSADHGPRPCTTEKTDKATSIVKIRRRSPIKGTEDPNKVKTHQTKTKKIGKGRILRTFPKSPYI